MHTGIMLYDADCGFCTRTAAWVSQLGMTARAAPIQSSDLAELGVDPDRAMREMPFVTVDGSVVYGHHAWAAVLRTGSAPFRWAGSALDSPLIAPIATRVYHWVSANRDRLPGGTPACAIPSRPESSPNPARPTGAPPAL